MHWKCSFIIQTFQLLETKAMNNTNYSTPRSTSVASIYTTHIFSVIGNKRDAAYNTAFFSLQTAYFNAFFSLQTAYYAAFISPIRGNQFVDGKTLSMQLIEQHILNAYKVGFMYEVAALFSSTSKYQSSMQYPSSTSNASSLSTQAVFNTACNHSSQHSTVLVWQHQKQY